MLLTFDILTKMVTVYIIHKVWCNGEVSTCDLTESLLPRIALFIETTLIYRV